MNAEEMLRREKELLEDALGIASVGSCELDLTTGERLWSAELCRLLGLDREHCGSHQELLDHVVPEDRDLLRDAEAAAAAAPGPYSVQFRIVREGSLRTLELRGRVAQSEDGRALRLIAAVQDITENVAREDALRRVVVQQAVVANLGHSALSGMNVDNLLRHTAALVTVATGVEFSEVQKALDDGLLLVAGEGWDSGSVWMEKTPRDRGSQASYVLSATDPVVITDVEQESRFRPSDLILRHKVTSGVTVRIDAGRSTAWGSIGAYSLTARTFSTSDVDFLRTVSTILGQAIERDAVDAVLRSRAVQQSAIAELGRSALNGFDTDLLTRAADLVAAALNVDHSFFLEVSPGGQALRFRAGHRVASLPEEIPLADTTQAGRTLLTGRPAVVADYAKDERFEVSREIAAHAGLAGGMTVPVASSTTPYGVLAALTRSHREFSSSDVQFLQSVANILADAIVRDEARRKLVESEERYRSVVEGASEIIFTVAQDSTIVALNSAFETITGWTRDQWLGRSFTSLVEPSQLPRVLGEFAAVFETREPMRIEVGVLGLERDVVLDVSAFPLVRDETAAAIYGFARDVTKERQIGRERAEATRRLQLVLESTVEGMFTIDLDGRCTMINASAARMLGGEPSAFLGRELHGIVHASRHSDPSMPLSECAIEVALRRGSPDRVVNDVFTRSDGFSLPVDFSAAPILDSGVVVGAVVAFIDMTERRLLEQKLAQATRLSSLGRLVATIAHEFNNVLMGISPFVDIIRRRPEVADTALDQIARSVRRGKGITEEILRFTQPSEPNRVPLMVQTLMQNVALEARSVLSAVYDVETNVAPADLQVDADPNQLHQIFMNLILNARDAMAGGGVISIRATEEPRDARFSFGVVRSPERFVHFAVSDRGLGMTTAVLEHIFEPLFTTKKSGTGIGLAVTHQVVQRHGGEIFVESETGAGSTFHIFLPMPVRVAAPPLSAREGVKESKAVAGDNERPICVLVVEDDPAVALGIEALLQMEGFEVEVASSGMAAIRSVELRPPDIVILDVGLPDIPGTQVHEKIALLQPGLPVIFSTGHADRAIIEDVISAAPVLHLLKPFTADALFAAIRRALAG